MITYLKINGFKSFHDFEMYFTPLTVVAGANASGKSNLFDALKLLSRLAETDIKTAFKYYYTICTIEYFLGLILTK